MKSKLLLVEDEEHTREAVAEYLSEMGYSVICAEDGQQGIELFHEHTFDLIILDIMLPKANGFIVLNEIRKKSQVPVLMLTAMSDEYTQIMSFDQQADDYITKPFSIVVLHKHVEALLRRSADVQVKDVWRYQDIEVDFIGYVARKQGEIVDIKPKEIQLLKMLLRYKGHVLSREQILDSIWNMNEVPSDRVIDVYIKNLRKKLQLDCIKTVKGIGYKYEEPL